ncbi:MAG: hypothetical protein ACLPGW_07595 [Roseiarcus sp.]
MTTDRQEETDAIEALLPWYAAGTLDPEDVKRVEAALARRPDLRASLETAREDRDETIALNEALGAPGPAAWARVLAVAQAEPRKPSLKARLAALVGLGAEPNRARLAWAGAAAAIVIVLQGATILSLLPVAKGPGYQTASETTAAAGGANVLVAFAPDARLDQVGAWLQQHHATIVEGPRGGLYRVRVGDKSLTKDQMSALVAELAASPLVRTALPAAGE